MTRDADLMTLPQDLGDGLVLRRATAADADALAAFNADIHRGPSAKPDLPVGAWTRDLLTRPHPTVSPGDFTVVEDTRTGAIASTLNLISQTWSYDGIPFGVGRPEMVGTNPAYRQRGLVRRQFDVIHRWSAERGELAQAITGIPWYYRQFGYELALALGGNRSGDRHLIPRLASGAFERFRLRPAAPADLPFIAQVYEQASRRYLVTCLRDAAQWRYELDGRSPENTTYRHLCVVESASGRPAGFLAYRPLNRQSRSLTVTAYEVASGEAALPDASWVSVTPAVLRALEALGAAQERGAEDAPFEGLTFALGMEHPVYHILPERLPVATRPYAWYLRVPDLPAFLRHIAPVLERRLSASEAAGYSGELQLDFFRSGVRLVFIQGRLAEVAPWSPLQPAPVAPAGSAGAAPSETAGFPDLTFLQLLFGYRSLDELEYAFADCRVRAETPRVLLNALFPKRPSVVWPIA